MAAQCGLATYPAGATIMREGDPGSFACVILEGEVDVFVELPAGPIHLATIGRDRIIGELGVFTDLPRTATVTTRTELVVIRIERDRLDLIGQAMTKAVAEIRFIVKHAISALY